MADEGPKVSVIMQYPGKSPRGMKKAFRRAMQAGNTEMGLLWRKEIFKKHFMPSAIDEYLYRHRNKQYMERKLSKRGHQNPLSYSGIAMSEVMSHYVVKASARHVGIHMPSPNAFKLSKAKHMPNLRQEARIFSDNDLDRMAGVATARYVAELNKDSNYDKEPSKTVGG